jgi:hypothetical protein
MRSSLAASEFLRCQRENSADLAISDHENTKAILNLVLRSFILFSIGRCFGRWRMRQKGMMTYLVDEIGISKQQPKSTLERTQRVSDLSAHEERRIAPGKARGVP